MMTAYGTVETAVEAMKLGAYNYLKNRSTSQAPGNGQQTFREPQVAPGVVYHRGGSICMSREPSRQIPGMKIISIG